MKSGSARGSRDVAKARMTAFEQFRVRGRPFVEVFKNSKGQEIAVVNPVQLKCRASDIFITGAKDSNARISNLGLFISPARLALLNDEQLLAFLIWNHAFMSLRHETNADAWEFLTLLANGRASSYEYSSSAHEKIDWITLTTLRAMNMNLNVYGSMLSTVQAYDTAIGLSLFGDKRFISKDSGGSPFGGEEKQTRLAAWVQLLEQDAQALAPANLKFSNILLSRPTWSTQTIPLVQLKTVREVLQPILGDADAKDASERYMSTFETIQRPANKPIDEQVAKTLMPATFQMIYAHHPTKRLIWIGRSMPSESDVNLCARPNDCSILVVGPHAVARPSAAWAQVLSEASGAYKLEERQ